MFGLGFCVCISRCSLRKDPSGFCKLMELQVSNLGSRGFLIKERAAEVYIYFRMEIACFNYQQDKNIRYSFFRVLQISKDFLSFRVIFLGIVTIILDCIQFRLFYH